MSSLSEPQPKPTKPIPFKSKLSGRTYSFLPTFESLTVAFAPKETDDQKVIREYENQIIAEIEEHSIHKLDETDVDLQVTGINGRRGFARVRPFMSDDPKQGDPASQIARKSAKLNGFKSVIRYMTMMVDKTEGNNNFRRYFLPDRIVVKFRKGSEEKFITGKDDLGSKVKYIIDAERGIYALDTPGKTSKVTDGDFYFALVDKYNQSNDVEWSEPYEVGFKIALWEPKDAHYYTDRIQWGLRNTGGMSGSVANADMNVYRAWNTNNIGNIVYGLPRTDYESWGNYGDQMVVVAPIDYGVGEDTVTYQHPDFEDPYGANHAIVDNGDQNFTGVGGTSIQDSSSDSHGTHVAGIIGGRKIHSSSVTDKRITGVVPKCKVMPLKINTDAIDYQDVVDAIDYVTTRAGLAANTNRRYVICMPWETGDNSQIRTAITDAWNTGRIVLVAAAGNSGANTPSFPAKHPNVIAAGAFTNANTKRSNSNYGSNEAGESVIFAPGQEIWSAVKGSQIWDDQDNTSCAAAFLAGAAAALWSRDKGIYATNNGGAVGYTLNNAQVKTKILNYTSAVTGGYVRHNLQTAVASIV